jgi:hypothetical protein
VVWWCADVPVSSQAIERTSLSRDVSEWRARYSNESVSWKQEQSLLREENQTLRADNSAVSERAAGLAQELKLMKANSGMGAEKQLEILVKLQMDNDSLRKQTADRGKCTTDQHRPTRTSAQAHKRESAPVY